MSGVRNDFCTAVSSGAGGSSRPRKNGISGCMPAVVRSVERSSERGTSDHEGCRRWPFDSKKERNPSRSSAVVFIAWIVRVPLSARSRAPRVLSCRIRSPWGGGWVNLYPRAPRRGSAADGAAPGLLLAGDLLADLLQRPADQPRDVHLRDPDLLRD